MGFSENIKKTTKKCHDKMLVLEKRTKKIENMLFGQNMFFLLRHVLVKTCFWWQHFFDEILFWDNMFLWVRGNNLCEKMYFYAHMFFNKNFFLWKSLFLWKNVYFIQNNNMVLVTPCHEETDHMSSWPCKHI